MSTITLTERIEAPAPAVYDAMVDFESAPQRISGIRRVEMITDGPVRVGTRFQETRVMFGREATEEMEVTRLEPGRGYTLECESCGCRYRWSLDVAAEGAGASRIDVRIETQPLTFGAKLMAPLGALMKGTMCKAVRKDLQDLKAALERPVHAAPA